MSCMRNNSLLWEQFSTQRDKIINTLRAKLQEDMAALIGHSETADLVLVAADGRKTPAHICILRQRAPVFFQRHVAPTLLTRTARQTRAHGGPVEVAVGDVDSAGLAFFIRSVYTDEEIAQLGAVEEHRDNEDFHNYDIDDDETGGRSGGSGGFAGGRSIDEDDTPRQQDRDSLNDAPGVSDQGPVEAEKPPTPVQQTFASTPAKKAIKRESDSGFHQPNSVEKPDDSGPPAMTSFRELASDSPMCLSNYSERSQYDIMEEDETEVDTARTYDQHGKFARLDDSGISSSRNDSPIKQRKTSTKIFPMFIGFGNNDSSDMTQSMPDTSATFSTNQYSSPNMLGAGSIRGRAMLARRLSVTSLTSLTSIDLTPTTESVVPVDDKLPCSKLAADLLDMYVKSVDTDVVVTTDDGDLHAHKCILWATCPSFRKSLKTSNRIELRGFSQKSINFLLTFLYGGVTCIPDDVQVWDVVSLATHLNLDGLAQVAILHLKTHKCHFFHRPCASCVSATFDALPQLQSIKCLNPLYAEAMQWQSRHFSRIWKSRVFLHMDEQWQRECRDALVAEVNEETIIETLLGAEKLQASLPRIKTAALAESVQSLVADVVEYCTDFLTSSFDLVVGSKSFKSYGKGLALNLGLMEELLPPLVHSLSADVAIRTFITLRDLLIEIQTAVEQQTMIQAQRSPQRRSDEFRIPLNDWSNRFIHLCRRLFESTDKHLLHYAFSVVKCDAYNLLSADEKARIEEAGIFVEMRMPRAPPPKLSSFNRAYKRSSSVGIGAGPGGRHDRTRSLERPRPIISLVLEASEKEERARDKTYAEINQSRLSRNDENHDPEPQEAKPQEQHAPAASAPAPKPTSTSTASLKRQASPSSKIPAPPPAKRETATRQQGPSESPATPKKQKPSTSTESAQPVHRSPKKTGPPPSKRSAGTSKTTTSATAQQNSDEFLKERHATQTIVTSHQIAELGIDPRDLGVPHVSESSPKMKPKSVVRPMPKAPSLAASGHTAPAIGPSSSTATSSQRVRPTSAKTTASSRAAAAASTHAPAKSRNSLPAASRPTAASAARASNAAAKRGTQVESKIPKVRA
uniref:BTB domain-containing protein n=1 Tax=Panagrellus redivivus TaxID=6233 RepID=A0A7E4VFN7_PANRE